MPYPVKGLLEVYEDMVEILLMLQVFLAEDPEINICSVVLLPALNWSVESPWTQWTPWTLSMDSVDIYHGLSGQSGQCPWILWTKPSESMDKVQ